MANVEAGTLGIMGLGAAMAIGYLRATDEEVDPLATTIVCASALFVLGGLNRNYEGMPQG